QITLWLKKIYGDQPIPQYEVNEKTVDILYDLMECSEARDRDVSLLVEELKHQTTEYKKQTKELEDSLRKSLGLSLSSLCNEATGSLSNLVESAMILETKDTSLISFSCAINSKTSELFEKESENREMERKWNTKRKKLMSALALERQLQEAIRDIEKCQTIENTKMENRSKNLEFLRHKSLELKIRTRAAEEEIIVKGLDKTLTHEALVQLSE
ncbi:HAUS1 protein, partial [Smithornis capensis]|nr:HAUS1 protein [Smithornis capensis]